MAQAGLDDITTALKGVLAAIVVNGDGDTLTAYAVEPAVPKPPCVWPFLREPAANYDDTFDGGMTWFFNLTVMVQASDPGHAQTNLKPYLAATGTKSIRAAVAADPSLGLSGVHAVVQGVARVGPTQVASISGWAAILALDVYADVV